MAKKAKKEKVQEEKKVEIPEVVAETSSEVRQELLESFDEVDRQAMIEALLFTQGTPVSAKRLVSVTGLPAEDVKDILDSIRMRHSLEESGVELFEAEGRYQLRSKPTFGPFIQQLKASRPKRLSQQALETLAIVAYRQPIVKSDVERIRGVDATPTLKTLIDRGFIKIVGHQQTIGQPALYGTTTQFLEVFGLSSLGELPSLRDLKELDADPGDEPSDSDEGEALAAEEEVAVEGEAAPEADQPIEQQSVA